MKLFRQVAKYVGLWLILVSLIYINELPLPNYKLRNGWAGKTDCYFGFDIPTDEARTGFPVAAKFYCAFGGRIGVGEHDPMAENSTAAAYNRLFALVVAAGIVGVMAFKHSRRPTKKQG